MTLHKEDQVNMQDKPYLVKSRLQREIEEDQREEEQPEPMYHTWDAMHDVGMKQSDFI